MILQSLKDIAEFIRTGKTPPTSETKYFNGDIQWFTPGDLDKSKFLVKSARTLTEEAFTDKKAAQYPPNTLLVACIGDIGKLGVTTQECSSNQQITGIKPKGNVDVSYLYYWFRNNKLLIQNTANNAVVPILNNKTLEQIKIPLLPLAEQQKIAAILDAADSLRQKDQQLVERYTALSQSLFLEMFGDPVTNPKQLKKITLDKVLKLKSGDFLPASLMVSNGKYPVFGGNGINGYHDQFMFDTRKIIIGRVGVYCGCVHVSPPNSWITDNALYVSEYDSEVNFDYLAYSLYQANLNQYASKSAQPLISGARLYPVEILLPEVKRQNQFAENLNIVKTQKQQAQRSLEKSEALFNSLLQRAFTGELTAKMAA